MSAQVTVVGAGDVLERYLGAAAVSASSSLHLISVVDIKSIDAARLARPFVGSGLSPPIGHSLVSGSPAELLELLKLTGSTVVIVATPTPTHLGYALACLGSGLAVGIEKPYVGTMEDAVVLDDWIRRNGDSRLFLFGYYLLEKGLPLVPLARRGAVPRVYLEEISPTIGAAEWARLRDRLGALVAISGCIFEGVGKKGQLSTRQWVLDQRYGGITLEQLYHLVCMCLLFSEEEGPADLVPVADAVQGAAAVEDVALGTDSGVLADYPLVGGLPPAETMALARLRLPAGTPVVIGAAKYVPAGLHQRWLKAEFEGGTAAMNFERRELELGFDGEKLYFGLSRAVNYATQWRVFEEKVLTPDLPIEYAISLRALRLALALREMGLARGIKPLRLGDRAIARIRTVIDRPSDLLSLSEALGG